jgi:hypothetical protein
MSFPRMARISSRVPSSRATEINLQSRYPGGMLVTKIEYLSWFLVLVPPASAIVAPVLSVGRGLVVCACAFLLMTTTAMVRAEAIVRIAKKFFVFIFVFGLFVILLTQTTARIPPGTAKRARTFRRFRKANAGMRTFNFDWPGGWRSELRRWRKTQRVGASAGVRQCELNRL